MGRHKKEIFVISILLIHNIHKGGAKTEMINDSQFHELKTLDTLKDLGMENEASTKIIEYLKQGQNTNAKNILLSYRSELLSSIHVWQEKLYRIDFLVRKF